MRSQKAGWQAFTLVELLVVIAIIGILASMTAVVISRIRVHGQITESQRQMHQLLNAIVEYHSDTGAYPISDGVKGVAIATGNDFSYGGSSLDAVFGGPGAYSTNNSEVIAILMGLERYPNTGGPTVNFGHAKNTRQKRYLTVDMVDGTDRPGVGQDLVYRDPWGNPYVISFDLNYDEKCRDALYEKSTVSKGTNAIGFYSLVNSSDSSGNSDRFEYRGGVMIWSLGPDKRGDSGAANAGANKDNVLIWR